MQGYGRANTLVFMILQFEGSLITTVLVKSYLLVKFPQEIAHHGELPTPLSIRQELAVLKKFKLSVLNLQIILVL